MQRHGSAGITGTAPAGNNYKIKIDQRLNDARYLILGVRINDHKRIFHTPVGCVRHMAGSRKTVETNVVGTSVLLQLFENQPAKIPGALKGALELFNHHQRSLHQSCDFSGRNFIERRKLLANRINSVVERFNQKITSFLIEQHVFLQVGISLNHPNIAQYFIKHSGGSSRLTRHAKFV